MIYHFVLSFTEKVLKTRVMLRANGVVYTIYLIIIRCVTPETHDKRCVKEGKWRGKTQLQWFGFTQTSWENFGKDWGDIWILDICLKHSNEMNRNDKRCSCLSSREHSWKLAKIPISNHLCQAFDQVGKSFSDYKPGTNWCTKCKVEVDKKIQGAREACARANRNKSLKLFCLACCRSFFCAVCVFRAPWIFLSTSTLHLVHQFVPGL